MGGLKRDGTAVSKKYRQVARRPPSSDKNIQRIGAKGVISPCSKIRHSSIYCHAKRSCFADASYGFYFPGRSNK